MPIYEYRCIKCGHNFEKLIRLSAPTPKCPECGAEESQKKVSVGSFVLRGEGWYKDHYGLKGSSPSGEGSSKKSE